ncbi:Methyltransferase-like protein 7B [Gaertneriomyces sp. JEL0708]|nr:Methyltransferase-like protein 7B [Gaertneriomyces sp. JEL0708]
MAAVKRFPLLAAAVGLYGASTYAGYHAYRIYKAPTPPPGISDPSQQEVKHGVFDALAPEYDARISWDEWLMRLGTRRRDLVKQAYGSVLEVSAGTGRNLEYYASNKSIKEITLSDVSEPMLQKAYARMKHYIRELPTSHFHIYDAENIPAGDGQFDTVIDTFGLCSCGNPVKALKEMARCCKKDGRVLLLEHGRGKYQFLNEALDKTAHGHADKWGCWWNRDIERIVDEAGLEIIEMERFHFGTTFWMIAKPKA